MSTTPQYRIEQYLAAINAAYLGESPLPEYPAEPVWRIEQFLAAILSAVKGDSPVMACPDPVWHIEEFARAIYDALVGASPAWPCPTATNNIEAILHAIYKVVADGTETDGIATSWDIERWLLDSYDAAKEGGGGGTQTTVTGNLPLTLANALSKAIVSLTRYGLCTQDGTPTPSAPVDIMCNNGAIKWDSVNQRVYADGTPEVLTVIPGEHLVLSASDFTQETATRVKTAEFIAVQPGTDYVFAFDLVDTVSGVEYDTQVKMYNADGDKLRDISFSISGGCRSGQFTADSNEVKVKVYVSRKSSSDTITPADIVSFVFDAQSTSYDPAGKNLFNRLNCVFGSYLNGNGAQKSGVAACYSCPIPVDSNKTYTFSGISGSVGSNNKRACFYRENDSFISAQTFSVTDADAPYSITFTPPENTAYCRLSLNTADTEVMLEEGSTQTAYEPYIDASWQTASVPMLLSVGDVKDEVELIHGPLTRRVTACLYDGTQPVGDVYMSTTGGKDAGAIIVYPLATPTTEQTTAQHLYTYEGTNIVDSVANVSPLEAEVTYKANV